MKIRAPARANAVSARGRSIALATGRGSQYRIRFRTLPATSSSYRSIAGQENGFRPRVRLIQNSIYTMWCAETPQLTTSRCRSGISVNIVRQYALARSRPMTLGSRAGSSRHPGASRHPAVRWWAPPTPRVRHAGFFSMPGLRRRRCNDQFTNSTSLIRLQGHIAAAAIVAHSAAALL